MRIEEQALLGEFITYLHSINLMDPCKPRSSDHPKNSHGKI